MKLFLKFVLFGITILVISWAIYSCSCSNCGKKEEASVPIDVLNKANEFIISKTGEEFFSSYITPDFVRTKYAPPYYEIAYRLYLPEKPYVNTVIIFTVDSIGNVVKKRDVIGIPNCKEKPTDCNWQIDTEGAISIAKRYGLEKGIKDWQVGFIWNPERQIYVWYIVSTIHEFEGDFGYRGRGKEMLIDPVHGDVLALNDWNIR
ncbi:MAG: hypothetical protein IH950_01860 [Bacteroidetes bacterium]|nr:hypothetical protein [Bacteroidota bacterium]MCH8032488.1 hypothetical protein [Bacteroidota bacterium]